MLEKTLREVCAVAKVSRRAVQGYEKAGLVAATGHNDRGHLLYDESALRRIVKIKMYQEFGFTVKEIVKIIDAPCGVRRLALEERVVELIAERERLDTAITRVYELLLED